MQVSVTDIVTPGQYVMFRCPAAQTPVRFIVTMRTSGWQWAFVYSSNTSLPPPAYGSLTWRTTTNIERSPPSGNITQVYFFLSPTTAVPPSSAGAITVDIRRPNSQVQYTSTLSATRTLPPTATPTSTPTPTATPTPSPTPVPPSACVRQSPSAVADPAQPVSFSCEGRTGGALGESYSGTVSNLTPGWEYRINGGAWLTTGSSLPTTPIVLGRSVPAFTIELRPTASVPPGSTDTVTVTVTLDACLLALCPAGYTATPQAQRAAIPTPTPTVTPSPAPTSTPTLPPPPTLTPTPVPPPSAADLSISCTPNTVTASITGSQHVTCTYRGNASLGTRQVTLTQVVIAAPGGWTIDSSDGTVNGTTLILSPSATISYSPAITYDVSFTLTPACEAPAFAQSVPISSTFGFNGVFGYAGAGTTVTASRADTSTTISPEITNSTLAWTRPYSLSGYPTNTGELTYRITASGCDGWSINVVASPFAYYGPANGLPIPASNLTLTGSTSPGGPGMTTPSTSGSLDQPLTVLNASASNGNGAFTQTLRLNLNIPAGAVVGTYISTITISASSGP